MTQSNKKIKEIGKKLPHGAKKKIAQTTGLSYNTVAGYFRGNEVSFYTEALILANAKAIIDLVNVAEQAKNELLNYGNKLC